MSGLFAHVPREDEALPRVQRPLPPHPEQVASMHGKLVETLGSGIALGHVTGTLDLDGIARRFGVSRSLVREALRTLAAKGMVAARQRAGTRVTDPSEWAALDEQVIRWRAAGADRFVHMHDSLDIRVRVEPLAARKMAQAAQETHVQALVRAAEQIRTATTRRDPDLMLQADTAFHRTLYLGSGSHLLAAMAGTVHACLWVPDFQNYGRFSAATADRHDALARAVQEEDPTAAEAVCGEMMTWTVDLFTEAYRQLHAARER